MSKDDGLEKRLKQKLKEYFKKNKERLKKFLKRPEVVSGEKK